MITLARWFYLAALASGLSGDEATIETTMNIDPEPLEFVELQAALAQIILEGVENVEPVYSLHIPV